MNPYRVVFLADDDIDDQKIFVDAIKEVDKDIQCFCSRDGEEALKALSDSLPKPDLIFLDLNMPGLNGKQTLAEIKKREDLRDIPVIMYSTFFGQRDIQEIKALGAVYFLAKPTEFNKLVNSLNFVLTQEW